MGDTKIEVGKWYRARHMGERLHCMIRVEAVDGCRVLISWPMSNDPSEREWRTADSLAKVWEPWVPRVGERVRVVGPWAHVCTVPWTVCRVGTDGVKSMYTGQSADGRWWEAPLAILEPCLPPAEVAPQQAAPVTEPPATTVLARRDDGAACRVCGGPAYMGLGLGPPECCAEKCEPVDEMEPIVIIDWKAPGPPPEGDGPERLAWLRSHERFFCATGHGAMERNPVRSEAVRLWREAVRRG